MKNTGFFILVTLCAASLYLSCKKRPVADIELYGRVVDTTASGSTLIPATIKLWTGAPPGESGSTYFGQTVARGDGTFSIKSKAGWNSSHYWLLILTHKGSRSIRYFVAQNTSLDVGEIAF